METENKFGWAPVGYFTGWDIFILLTLNIIYDVVQALSKVFLLETVLPWKWRCWSVLQRQMPLVVIVNITVAKEQMFSPTKCVNSMFPATGRGRSFRWCPYGSYKRLGTSDFYDNLGCRTLGFYIQVLRSSFHSTASLQTAWNKHSAPYARKNVIRASIRFLLEMWFANKLTQSIFQSTVFQH